MREVKWFVKAIQMVAEQELLSTDILTQVQGSLKFTPGPWNVEKKKKKITQASGENLKSDKVTIITIYINTGPGHATLVLSMDVDRQRSNVHLSTGENAQSIPITHH